MQSLTSRFTLLLLTAAVLAACGGAPTTQAPTTAPAPDATPLPATEATAAPAAEPTAAPPASGEQASVSFWFQPDEGTETNCFIDTAITPFNERNGPVIIEAVAQPNVWDATRTAIAGGAGPDIVETPGPSFAFELVQAGQLLPLDDLAQQYQWNETFVPWALNLGKVDGKLYSLPTAFETLVLYYNKTLFEEKGWTVPTTMDELMTLSATIKDAGITPFAHSNAEWRPTNEWFVGTFLNRVAGPENVYKALRGEKAWTDAEFVQALDTLNQMQQQGYFMGGLDRYYTATNNERYAAFGNGEVAMNIEGTWAMGTGEGSMNSFFGEAAGNQNEWDWIAIPAARASEQVFDIGIGSTYSINTTAKNPQAAAEFLTYLLSPETQSKLLKDCGWAPAPVRLQADALEGIDPRTAAIYEAMGKASDAGTYGYTTWTFWPPKSDVYVYEEVEKVWSGEMTSQQYLEGLQAVFDEELKAGDIPPIPER